LNPSCMYETGFFFESNPLFAPFDSDN